MMMGRLFKYMFGIKGKTDKNEYDEDDVFTATELAKVAGIRLSGYEMNIMLINLGFIEDWFQVPREEWGDDFKFCSYRLTEKGKKYGGVYYGAFYRNIICWNKDIIPIVQAEYKRVQENENNERLARTNVVLNLLNIELEKINDKVKFDLNEIQEIKIENSYRYDLKSRKVKESLHIYYDEYKNAITIKNNKWRKIELQDMLKDKYLRH